jgi:hypothetical protein
MFCANEDDGVVTPKSRRDGARTIKREVNPRKQGKLPGYARYPELKHKYTGMRGVRCKEIFKEWTCSRDLVGCASHREESGF